MTTRIKGLSSDQWRRLMMFCHWHSCTRDDPRHKRWGIVNRHGKIFLTNIQKNAAGNWVHQLVFTDRTFGPDIMMKIKGARR